MTDFALDDRQATVIAALSAGYSPEKAAELAGVNPMMIDLWRRNEIAFQRALLDTHYIRAIQFREKALALADRALKTLSDLLDDPKASPSVRLKAATFIFQTAIAPPRFQPAKPVVLAELPLDLARQIAGLDKEPQAEKDKPAA
jgi:hypothetical protein